MNYNPEAYNAKPYNYAEDNDSDPRIHVLPFKSTFVDTISTQYIETFNRAKIITFDSGERSQRRAYIEATLLYLLQIKGIPAMVLSSLDQEYTRYYLTKLPSNLRSKVLDLGFFHVYNSIVASVRDILKNLFVDLRYRDSIDYFVFSLKSLQAKLLKALNQLGLVVILDRSLISTYLYNHSIKAKQTHLGILQLEALRHFKPYASFFVHTLKQQQLAQSKDTALRKGSLYDSYEFLNYNIRSILPQVKNNLPVLTELHDYVSFEENLKIIKDTLKNL